MNEKTQIACVVCGAAFVALFTLGWIIVAGLVPAPSPSFDAAAIAAFYDANTGSIRFGLLITMISASLTIPWVAVVGVQMRRTERDFPVLTATQLVAGAVTVVFLTVPVLIWTVAAFRPERTPELIQLMSDFGWIMLIMTFPPFFVQLVAIGLAIVSDNHERPVFARWLGYFNIWVAILFLPGGLITFFKSGPFAWNGLLAFWLPLTVFFLWYIVMFFALIRAIRQPSTA
ncbi:MAG: hypothetical protein ACU85U_10275 [Gammaproteobacteria bacterium]|jgi:hypothetical protein